MKRLVLLTVLALAACADPHEPLSRDFGNAVRANIAAQVVNPNPTPVGTIDTNGQRMGTTIDRYVNNKVYQPHLPLVGGEIVEQH
jgi:type IV pilus biogenesis protein CpaD/CtpE